jgi:serine/threonine-protein phosphatase 2B catalytic subunit
MAGSNQEYFQSALYQIPERDPVIPGGTPQWSDAPGVSYKDRAVPNVSV